MTQKRTLTVLTAVLAIGFALPAYADCASDIEQVNAAMESSNLSDGDRASIEAAKLAAEAKLNAGDEDGCQADMMQVKSALQIN